MIIGGEYPPNMMVLIHDANYIIIVSAKASLRLCLCKVPCVNLTFSISYLFAAIEIRFDIDLPKFSLTLVGYSK